jgi:hypothetical protein
MMILGLSAVDPQIALAARFDRGMPHIDRHALAPAGAQPPQFGGRQRRGAYRRLDRRSNREGRRQHRLGTGEMNVAKARLIEPGLAPQPGEHLHRVHRQT